MTAIYRGVRFRSRLVSQWAAWFDHVGLKWRASPITIEHWTPDFSLATDTYDVSAWCHVVPARDVAELRVLVGELTIHPDVGDVIVVGRQPLTASVLGMIGGPAGWRPSAGSDWGISGHLQARWAALHPRRGAPLADPAGTATDDPAALTEIYGGDPLPTWRARAERFARARWASPPRARDWGLVMQKIAETDELAAGTLMGAEAGRLGVSSIEVAIADPSIRAALCRKFTARFTDAVERALGLQLVVRYQPWRIV